MIGEAVLEGRRTFGSVLKYLMMGTSSNFGNMFSMAAASLFLPFLPMLPMQVLLNNLLYDLSELPIPSDRVDDDFLRRPHRWDNGFIRGFMVTVGPISSVFDLLTFLLLLHVFGGEERLFHSGWFVESLATQVLVIFVIRTRGSPLRARPGKLLVAAALSTVAAAVALPFTPVGARLGFAPLPAAFLALQVPLVAAYLSAVMLTKRWFYRRHPLA